MQDVVDLDEVLLRRLADVAGVELHLFESVHIAAVQRDLGTAVDQQLSHRAGHAGGVRHPHRFGDPEAGDVGDSPTSGAPSGVNEKMPLKPDSIVAVCRQGSSCFALLPRRREVVFGERQHRGHRRLR